MYKALLTLAACLTIPAPSLRADTVTFGIVRIDPDSPSLGLSAFVVTNLTGPANCDSFFNVCTPLSIDNGLLRIDYDIAGTPGFVTAILPDNFGPGEIDPFSFPDFNFDLSGWMLTSVTFSGLLSPAATPILTFDGVPLTLQPRTFSISFDPASSAFALLTATAGPPPPVTVPETGAWSSGGLLLSGCIAARGLLRKQQQQKKQQQRQRQN